MIIPISFQGLKIFGFNSLTAESCGYGMRMLFDVSERGKKHFEAFFGGNLTITKGSNWNSGFVERKGEERVKSVGSIMFPLVCGKDFLIQLLIFCALQEGYHVISMPGQLEIEKDEETIRRKWKTVEEIKARDILWKGSELRINNNSTGRNTHRMSGRTE